jgi:hypothetical protein
VLTTLNLVTAYTTSYGALSGLLDATFSLSSGYSLVVCVQLQLLGSLLDDVLKSEVGTELFNKVERIRSLAQCAAQLANKHDSVRQQPGDSSWV